jgi:hypothetical protein
MASHGIAWHIAPSPFMNARMYHVMVLDLRRWHLAAETDLMFRAPSEVRVLETLPKSNISTHLHRVCIHIRHTPTIPVLVVTDYKQLIYNIHAKVTPTLYAQQRPQRPTVHW